MQSVGSMAVSVRPATGDEEGAADALIVATKHPSVGLAPDERLATQTLIITRFPQRSRSRTARRAMDHRWVSVGPS
jgi:hypothetical protein